MPDPASATEAAEVTQIDKLCGDLIAYGYGAGVSWPQSSDQLANYEKARETRAEVGRLARRVSVEENAVDRHSEVMAKLDDFDKRGIKRR